MHRRSSSNLRATLVKLSSSSGDESALVKQRRVGAHRSSSDDEPALVKRRCVSTHRAATSRRLFAR
eukprot:12570958-Alexandrium_andersonii.AAC.1